MPVMLDSSLFMQHFQFLFELWTGEDNNRVYNSRVE